METTIDGAGRLVVPKPLREALGLSAGTRVRIEESRDGRLVLTAPQDTPPLTTETVRELVERGRR